MLPKLHTSTLVVYGPSAEDPGAWINGQTNVNLGQSTMRLFNGGQRLKGRYSQVRLGLFHIICLWIASKCERERERADVAIERSVNGIVVRPPIMYGRSQSFVAYYILDQAYNARNGGTFETFVNEDTRWLTCHQDDVGELFRLVGEKVRSRASPRSNHDPKHQEQGRTGDTRADPLGPDLRWTDLPRCEPSNRASHRYLRCCRPCFWREGLQGQEGGTT